jgi:cytochrome c6
MIRRNRYLLAALALVAVVGAAQAAELENGKKVFEAKCAMCHAKDGKGNAAMVKMFGLASDDILNLKSKKISQADFIRMVEGGKGKMPAFKDKMQAADLPEVYAYVKSLAGGKGAKAATAAKAEFSEATKALYDGKCASCHGKDGKGNAALNKMFGAEGLDLTKAATAAKTQAELVEIVRKGAGKMPGYDGQMSEAEIQAVTRYSDFSAPNK